MDMVAQCHLSHRIVQKILLKQALPKLSKDWFLIRMFVLNDVMLFLIIENQKHNQVSRAALTIYPK